MPQTMQGSRKKDSTEVLGPIAQAPKILSGTACRHSLRQFFVLLSWASFPRPFGQPPWMKEVLFVHRDGGVCWAPDLFTAEPVTEGGLFGRGEVAEAEPVFRAGPALVTDEPEVGGHCHHGLICIRRLFDTLSIHLFDDTLSHPTQLKPTCRGASTGVRPALELYSADFTFLGHSPFCYRKRNVSREILRKILNPSKRFYVSHMRYVLGDEAQEGPTGYPRAQRVRREKRKLSVSESTP